MTNYWATPASRMQTLPGLQTASRLACASSAHFYSRTMFIEQPTKPRPPLSGLLPHLAARWLQDAALDKTVTAIERISRIDHATSQIAKQYPQFFQPSQRSIS